MFVCAFLGYTSQYFLILNCGEHLLLKKASFFFHLDLRQKSIFPKKEQSKMYPTILAYVENINDKGRNEKKIRVSWDM